MAVAGGWDLLQGDRSTGSRGIAERLSTLVGDGGFVGRWIEVEYSGNFPNGVAIEVEGDHYLWIDDDGTFLARTDEEGNLIIDTGIGQASAVLSNGGMVHRAFGNQARFRRETSEDIARQAAEFVPAACATVGTQPIENVFGSDFQQEDRGQSCYFRGPFFDWLEVTIVGMSLDEWQARWEGRCDPHVVEGFSNGVLCEDRNFSGVLIGWFGAYWANGMTITIEVSMPGQGAMRRGSLESILTGIDMDDGVATEDCDEMDEVRLQLQWFAQAQFAGYYVAHDLGFYEDQCLDVTIFEGAVEIVPQQVLATGGAEFGLAWVPKALVSRDAGADIVNIAQVFERSGTLMVSWADTGITEPADWAGKKVGNWGFGNEFELTAAISRFGVADVELIGQDFSMTALLNREIDAAQAMIYNEYAQLLEVVNPDTGELYQPEDFSVIDFNDIGTAMLQDAVWVNAEWIAEAGNEDIAVRFLTASFQGWIHCLDNFDECVDIVLDNGPALGQSHQEWQLNEILALIFPATNGIGVMNVDLWDQTVDVATSEIPELGGKGIPSDAFRTDLAEAAIANLGNMDTGGDGYQRRTIELREGGE